MFYINPNRRCKKVKYDKINMKSVFAVPKISGKALGTPKGFGISKIPNSTFAAPKGLNGKVLGVPKGLGRSKIPKGVFAAPKIGKRTIKVPKGLGI
jgi:hypothetical protein